MRGEFVGVWQQMAREVWSPMEASEDALSREHADLLAECPLTEDYEGHPDLFGDLFREAHTAMRNDLRSDEFGEATDEVVRRAIDVAEIASRPDIATDQFLAIESTDFASEGALVGFLERAYDLFAEYDDLLATRYQKLLRAFVSKYNLSYDVLDPCQIYPTVPGAFASLFRELDRLSGAEASLQGVMEDFKSAYRDIKFDSSESRIRACIHKMVVLVEAISLQHNDVAGKTLGEACRQLRTWPHAAVKESLSKLYGFSSDYPGIRHAGNTNAKERDLDSRDLIALCIILCGYMPYLINDIDCGTIYMSEREPGE